ncbi:unnamed protein product [Closterium sp. NIES-54]
MVTTTKPGGQRVSICTCTRTGRHLATCVCPGVRVRSGSTPLLVSPPVTLDSPVAPPPWSPLPATPSWHALPPPCFWSSQRAAPHSSSFPSMTAPLQTLHMDVKGEVPDVLIPWIRAFRLQLRERFRQDLPVLRLHSDRGGEFSSNLLREFSCGLGILHSFTLPASPQPHGIAERRIGLVIEVARTSMIHAAAPHFLWPFAVRYVAHQLNLWPRVSLPETSPTLRWTGKVGDASEFRVVTEVQDNPASEQHVTAVERTGNETRSTGGQVGLYHPPFEKCGLLGSSLQEVASGKTS